MRQFFDGLGYYLSCLVPFNVICLLSCISKWEETNANLVFSEISQTVFFWVVVSSIISGVVSTVIFLSINDIEKCTASTGRTLKINSLEDKTGENYFANYSLIVLTGISLPSLYDWLSLAVYLIVVFMLGIVYIKKMMYYMNPVITLFGYNFYKCNVTDITNENNDVEKQIYILLKGKLMAGETISKIKNINTNMLILKL